jgi:acetyl-CoA carboxylase carboxyltransferase component
MSFESTLDVASEAFEQNRTDMLRQLQELDELLHQRDGDEAAIARLRAAGKLPVRERISHLLDRDSPFLELSPLAAWHSYFSVGAGVVTGIGVVSGVECVVIANDPAIMAGALNPFAMMKIMRALQIARENRLPLIQFVESAGADLRGEVVDPELETRLSTSHFGAAGRVFYEISELSKAKVPTIAVVFGNSTAGGAYLPGMSDYTIFIKGQSKVLLAGPPLVKMATGEDSDEETLGGGQMHAEVSGLADFLARNEHEAIDTCRRVVARLNWRKLGPAPSVAPAEPRHDPEELLGLIPESLRSYVDVREVIVRIVDGSQFDEFKEGFGPELVCGWASIHGYPVGILGNNGVLMNDSALKGAQFIQLCNQSNLPIIFLQNLTGFIVGPDFERAGITKNGAKLINALSNSETPHLTMIVGASYGAGNFAMGGRAFGTRFTFLWPTAKIAVMGPKQMTGVMTIVNRARAERRGQVFDEAADAARAAKIEHWSEFRSRALYATSRVTDDGIIDPRDSRTVLGFALSACHSAPVKGTAGYAVFRM